MLVPQACAIEGAACALVPIREIRAWSAYAEGVVSTFPSESRLTASFTRSECLDADLISVSMQPLQRLFNVEVCGRGYGAVLEVDVWCELPLIFSRQYFRRIQDPHVQHHDMVNWPFWTSVSFRQTLIDCA
jgi:hypothetical protein